MHRTEKTAKWKKNGEKIKENILQYFPQIFPRLVDVKWISSALLTITMNY